MNEHLHIVKVEKKIIHETTLDCSEKNTKPHYKQDLPHVQEDKNVINHSRPLQITSCYKT